MFDDEVVYRWRENDRVGMGDKDDDALKEVIIYLKTSLYKWDDKGEVDRYNGEAKESRQEEEGEEKEGHEKWEYMIKKESKYESAKKVK